MSVTLSTGVRQNLQALQSTADMLSTVQNRLATGKKVNSALDNPNSFFTAQSLESRAGDLGGLLDDMGQSIQTLRAADEGIKGITKLVEAAKAKANQALQSSVAADRTTYQDEFNTLMTQIEELATDSGYKGKNLLKGDSLTVTFNEDGSSSLDVTGVDYTDSTAAAGLNIADASGWTADSAGDTAIGTSITALNTALTTLRKQASTFGTNLTTVENRQNFTKAMISTLQQGADKLTLADNNEEGAKLLALNTRQQLASTAVSFASQADQNVLRLF
jgi:flagellin